MPSVCLLAGSEESGKYTPMGLALWRKRFWMPLHAQGKTMACTLDTFNNAVIRKRVDDQSLADSFYCLMMAGIDLETAASNDRVEACLREDLDVVASVGFFLALFVFHRGRHLGGDILIKRAAECHIERLLAAA